MYGKRDKHHHPDAVIAWLAARQHGIVTLRQLRRHRLSDGEIEARVRSGHLHRLYRGVYAVGHTRLTREARFLAAVFAYGVRAALSHEAAAVHWRLLPPRGPRIDVTVPSGGGRRGRRAIVLHRSPLPEAHVTVRDAMPVTTPARTIIDLADYGRRRLVERAIDEADFLRLDLTGLEPIRGRRGAGLLRSVLAGHEPGTTRTRSRLEEDMLAICRRHGLAKPLVNQPIGAYTCDFVWAAERLVVETDGWQAHGTRRAFESDRVRDAELVEAGWRVVRITWRRLRRRPDAVARQLARLLGVDISAAA